MNSQRGEISILHVIMLFGGFVTFLLAIAIHHGHNGILLTSGIASLVGMVTGYGGYKLGQKSVHKKE